jgi:hypothetical protein
MAELWKLALSRIRGWRRKIEARGAPGGGWRGRIDGEEAASAAADTALSWSLQRLREYGPRLPPCVPPSRFIAAQR